MDGLAIDNDTDTDSDQEDTYSICSAPELAGLLRTPPNPRSRRDGLKLPTRSHTRSLPILCEYDYE